MLISVHVSFPLMQPSKFCRFRKNSWGLPRSPCRLLGFGREIIMPSLWVVLWGKWDGDGHPESGGDSSAVQHQLKRAQHIQATAEGTLLPSWLMDRSLGQAILWRGLFFSARSAQECAANSVHTVGICCNLGEWFNRFLGQ